MLMPTFDVGTFSKFNLCLINILPLGWGEELRKVYKNCLIGHLCSYAGVSPSLHVMSVLQGCVGLWNAGMLCLLKVLNDVKVTDICLLETNTSQNNR